MINPPITAVKRVDFLLQIPIVIGDINNERQVDVAPNHPVNKTENNVSIPHERYFAIKIHTTIPVDLKLIKLNNGKKIMNYITAQTVCQELLDLIEMKNKYFYYNIFFYLFL